TTEEINSPESSLTLRAIPLVRGGKLFQLVLVLTERTEIRRKEEELQVKHSVIKEIHHRVKNNLQTVAGILRMQMRRVEHEEAR
ncbi:histidine kinase dimerization/phosphoacceptor domain -containing protein, partial [Anaeroglobus sp. AF13-6AC]